MDIIGRMKIVLNELKKKSSEEVRWVNLKEN